MLILKHLGIGILLSAAAFAAGAAELYVDAKKGDDAGDGSAAKPFKTIGAAFKKAVGGDTVYLMPGEYGKFDYRGGKGKHLFQNGIVTLCPAKSVKDGKKEVKVENLTFGARASDFAGERRSGIFEINLRVKDVNITDGVFVHGGDNLEIDNCLINRKGPLVGSKQAIEKTAVFFGMGKNLVLKNSEITSTALGATISGLENKVLNTTIHDITHDGIRCVSSKDCLIDGVKIYNLDDGVEDNDPRGKGWNRHCDAIHIFIPGPGIPGAENENLTIRNSLMYNCESQAIQFNNYFRNPKLRNKNVTIENCVFGPTRANTVNIADPVDGIIFRHNTYITRPGGMTFRGMGRDIHCNNSVFRISDNCTKAEVYNNILCNSVNRQPGWFVSNNIYVSDPRRLQTSPGRFDKVVQDVKLVDPANYSPVLAADSPAIDAGVKRPGNDQGINGVARDARPDIGAFEMPGRNPQPWPPMPKVEGEVTTYVDDFVDGDLSRDPYLAGKNQSGIEWRNDTAKLKFRVIRWNVDGKNYLCGMGNKGFAYIVSEDDMGKRPFEATVTLLNAYNTIAGGFIVMAAPDGQGIYLDAVGGKIFLRKKVGDNFVDEEVAKGPVLLGSHDKVKVFNVKVTPAGDTVNVEISGEKGKISAAVSNFAPGGRIGYFFNSKNGSHRTDFGEVKVMLK